jgi:hypothetical protein
VLRDTVERVVVQCGELQIVRKPAEPSATAARDEDGDALQVHVAPLLAPLSRARKEIIVPGGRNSSPRRLSHSWADQRRVRTCSLNFLTSAPTTARFHNDYGRMIARSDPAAVDVSIIPVAPWEVEGAIGAKGGGSTCAKRTSRKNHRLTRNRVPGVRTVVSKGMPRPVRPYANLVRDLDHKALAWFFGRGNSIEGNQRKCS